jgi:hypothetical protein
VYIIENWQYQRAFLYLKLRQFLFPKCPTHFLYIKAFFPSSCSLKGGAYEVTFFLSSSIPTSFLFPSLSTAFLLFPFSFSYFFFCFVFFCFIFSTLIDLVVKLSILCNKKQKKMLFSFSISLCFPSLYFSYIFFCCKWLQVLFFL